MWQGQAADEYKVMITDLATGLDEGRRQRAGHEQPDDVLGRVGRDRPGRDAGPAVGARPGSADDGRGHRRPDPRRCAEPGRLGSVPAEPACRPSRRCRPISPRSRPRRRRRPRPSRSCRPWPPPTAVTRIRFRPHPNRWPADRPARRPRPMAWCRSRPAVRPACRTCPRWAGRRPIMPGLGRPDRSAAAPRPSASVPSSPLFGHMFTAGLAAASAAASGRFGSVMPKLPSFLNPQTKKAKQTSAEAAAAARPGRSRPGRGREAPVRPGRLRARRRLGGGGLRRRSVGGGLGAGTRRTLGLSGLDRRRRCRRGRRWFAGRTGRLGGGRGRQPGQPPACR